MDIKALLEFRKTQHVLAILLAVDYYPPNEDIWISVGKNGALTCFHDAEPSAVRFWCQSVDLIEPAL
jgi:hypothetical protein